MTALAKLAFASLLAAAALPESRLPVPPPAELADRSGPVRQLVVDASRSPDKRVETAVLRPELFVQWSKPLALESIAVRRRVLGPEHLETAGSERFLASWVYESWSRQRRRSPRSPTLPEARDLAQHALGILEAAYGVSHGEVVGTRMLLARIALGMQEFALAEDLGLQLVNRYEAPCQRAGDGPSALELLADAVRGQARIPEAEEYEAAAAACDAGEEPP